MDVVFRALLRSVRSSVCVVALSAVASIVTPSDVFASPYCVCRAKCVYDTGGICLAPGGGTTATVYWMVRFNYRVDDGDPHGSTLTNAAAYPADCRSSTGIAQRSLNSYADGLCSDKVSTLAWLNAFGYAHTTSLYSCTYETTR